MAKDRELADHERAHSGKPGDKVEHGDIFPMEREEINRNRVHDLKSIYPSYGYRKISALSKTEGVGGTPFPLSTRQVRKHLKTYD